MTYYYTALFRPSTGEIQYAEHFEDESERDKRASQLEPEAARMSPPDVDGEPTEDSWLCYSGPDPVEAELVRMGAKPTKDETVAEDDPKDVAIAKWQAFADRVAAEAAEAALKTTSILTAPEHDDRHEAREIPPLQLAMSAVEKATQAVLDAKQGTDALQLRADNLAAEAYGTGAASEPEERKQALRRKAVDAQAEADNEKARLYHAEQDLAEKIKAVEGLKNA